MTLFRVSRTSTKYHDDHDCPIPGAVKGTAQRWDCRTFKSPEEHDAKLGGLSTGLWHDRGTEHGFIYGPRGGVHGIKRRMEDEPAWFLEVPDLDALVRLAEEHGELVLGYDDNGHPAIEVYDGYRE